MQRPSLILTQKTPSLWGPTLQVSSKGDSSPSDLHSFICFQDFPQELKWEVGSATALTGLGWDDLSAVLLQSEGRKCPHDLGTRDLEPV